MVIRQGAREQVRRLGIARPLRHGQAAQEADHLDQDLALGPIIADLGLEIAQTDLGAVLIRRLVNGEQRVAQQG